MADFKILAFQNPEFKNLADLKILGFQNPEFKISADFKKLALQNPEFKILADFKIFAFQNPEFKILAEWQFLQGHPKPAFSIKEQKGDQEKSPKKIALVWKAEKHTGANGIIL